MATITSITRPTVKMLRIEIDAALATISKGYGITIATGNASFTETSVSFKVVASTKTKTGIVMTREAEDYNSYARAYGLSDYPLGTTFKSGGYEYTIIGFKPRCNSQVIVARPNDTRTFRMKVQQVKLALELKAILN